MGDAEVADSKFKLEVTSDGTNWQAVDLKPGYRTQVKAYLKDLSVAKMRLVNVSCLLYTSRSAMRRTILSVICSFPSESSVRSSDILRSSTVSLLSLIHI